MKVALVYDRVNKFGGAERVLEVLHEMFPDAPLYTLVYNKETAAWADTFDVRTTFLQKLPLAKNNHESFPWLAPLAFESLDLSSFDVVISVTSEYAKGVITKPETLHICYCLTPTRYLWSGYKEYFSNRIFRFLTQPLISYLREWDKVASCRPDVFLAISEVVQKRIERYYGREATVIYPPSINLPNPEMVQTNSGYFLVVSRLVPYKRVDLAIKACKRLKMPLKIIGTGKEEEKLKQLAGPTIEFVGTVSDSELASYYQSCKALLYLAKEDFGLTMVEAMQFGKPVIAFGRGGAKEIVIPGVTGELFEKQTGQSLGEVLQNFDAKRYNTRACKSQAAKFGKEIFANSFRKTLENLWTTHQTTTHSS